MKHRAGIISAALIVCMALTIPAISQEQSQEPFERTKLRYSVVYKALQLGIKPLPGSTSTVWKAYVTSSLPNVKPRDIDLYIDSMTGRISVTMNEDQSFNFPMNADLLKEDPMLVANQPKGTLKLGVASFVTVPTPIGKMEFSPGVSRVKYSLVFDRVRIFREMQKYYVDTLKTNDVERGKEPINFTNGMTKAMKMLLGRNAGGNQKVIIHSDSGNIVFRSDTDGVCVIPFEEALFQEDPWVSLPTNIAPDRMELQPEGELPSPPELNNLYDEWHRTNTAPAISKEQR